MGIKDLIALCEQLSQSKGFYGRLLRRLQEADDKTLNEIDQTMHKLNLKDRMDIIFWLECGV